MPCHAAQRMACIGQLHLKAWAVLRTAEIYQAHMRTLNRKEALERPSDCTQCAHMVFLGKKVLSKDMRIYDTIGKRIEIGHDLRFSIGSKGPVICDRNNIESEL